MPSLEQSERVSGAAFLGIPAFDAFVWMLDYYARVELLVKLHGELPSFLLNPVTGFVCLCIGLGLLYSSNRRELRRIAESARNQRPLLDTFGTEVHSIEKPMWLLPVLAVFACALVTTPIVAIAYSLAYKGKAPETPTAPRPPDFAYVKTEKPKRLGPMSSAHNGPIAIAPQGIANAAPNFGNQTVNNTPPARRLPEDRTAFISCLALKPGRFSIGALADNQEAYNYAQDWHDVLLAAAWEIEHKDIPIQIFVIGGGMWSGMRINLHATAPNGLAITDNSPEKRFYSCITTVPLGAVGTLIPANDIPTGVVRISISSHP